MGARFQVILVASASKKTEILAVLTSLQNVLSFSWVLGPSWHGESSKNHVLSSRIEVRPKQRIPVPESVLVSLRSDYRWFLACLRLLGASFSLPGDGKCCAELPKRITSMTRFQLYGIELDWGDVLGPVLLVFGFHWTFF